MCGAGGDEGASFGVLFERNHWAAADQWVRTVLPTVTSLALNHKSVFYGNTEKWQKLKHLKSDFFICVTEAKGRESNSMFSLLLLCPYVFLCYLLLILWCLFSCSAFKLPKDSRRPMWRRFPAREEGNRPEEDVHQQCPLSRFSGWFGLFDDPLFHCLHTKISVYLPDYLHTSWNQRRWLFSTVHAMFFQRLYGQHDLYIQQNKSLLDRYQSSTFFTKIFPQLFPTVFLFLIPL